MVESKGSSIQATYDRGRASSQSYWLVAVFGFVSGGMKRSRGPSSDTEIFREFSLFFYQKDKYKIKNLSFFLRKGV